MNIRKISIFIVCLMLSAVNLFGDKTLARWNKEEFLEFNVNLYAMTSEADSHLKWKDSKWFYKGSHIYVYVDCRNADGWPNTGGDLRYYSENAGNKYIADGNSFTSRFILQQKEYEGIWPFGHDSWNTKLNKSLTFVSDMSAPSTSFNKDSFKNNVDDKSIYVFYNNGNNIYFNNNSGAYSSSTINYYWTKPNDDVIQGKTGSGVKTVHLKSGSSLISNVGKNATSASISLSTIGTSKNFYLYVEDEVTNSGTRASINYIQDITKPTFKLASVSYQPTPEEGKPLTYTTTLKFNSFSDNSGGSGILYNSFRTYRGENTNPDTGQVASSGLIKSNKTYDSEIKHYVRDQYYTYSSLFTDNVSNQSLVIKADTMLSAAAYLDTNDKKTRFEYDDLNNLRFKGIIDFGKYAGDDKNGIDNVELYIIDDLGQESKVLTVYPSGVDELKLKKDNDPNRTDGLEYEFDLNAKNWNITPHKSYKFKVKTKHKNIVTKEVKEYKSMPVTNKSVIGLNLTLGNESVTLANNNIVNIGKNNAEDEIAKLLESTPEVFTDYFPAEDLKDQIIPDADIDGDTVNVLPVSINYYQYIVIEEKFVNYIWKGDQLEAKPVTNTYLLTGYRFSQDSDVNTDGLEIKISDSNGVEYNNETKITNSNSVYIGINRVPEDQSGIKKITFFNVPESYKEKSEDFYNLGTLVEGESKLSFSGNSLELAATEAGSVLGANAYFISNVSEDTESFVYVSAKVEDNSGNYKFLPTKDIFVDRIKPRELTLTDGIIKVDSTSVISYDYSDLATPVTDVITLSLNNTILTADKAIISSVGITNRPDYITGNPVVRSNIITITLLPNFTPNNRVDISITLTDNAGNNSVSNLKFYTPGKVIQSDIEIDNFHNRDYSEWDYQKKNYIELTVVPSSSFEKVNIYDSNGAIVNGEDLDLLSHETYSYLFKTVNKSGFENNKSTYTFTKNVTVGNNSPKIVIDDSKFLKVNNQVVLGPKSSVFYNISDYDPDSHNLNFYILGDDRFNYSGAASTQIDISSIYANIANTAALANNTNYELYLGAKDQWGTDSILYGKEVVTDNVSFKYDSSSPVLEKSYYEKEDGYSYLNGDLYINIKDEISGMDFNDSGSISAVTSDGIVLVLDKLSGSDYTHKVNLPEGEYDIILNATDRLGNETSEPLINEPVRVDHSAPVVNSVTWGNNPNLIVDKNLVSTRIANFKVNWSDSFSRPSEITYKYLNNGKEVWSDTLDVRGKSEGNTGDIEVALYNNAPDILENSKYNIEVIVKDLAGNNSETYKIPFDIYYDLNAPLITLDRWNTFKRSGINYVNSYGFISPEVTISDVVDKSIVPQYQVYSYESDTLGPLEASISNIVLTKEGEYDLYIVAKDDSGHSSSVKLPFMYDTLAPKELGIKYTENKKDSYKGGETLTLEFEGTNVYSYFYRLINQETGSVLPQESSANGWVEVDKGVSTNYSLTLPRVEDQDQVRAVVWLKAVDIAGNDSIELVAENGNILIDNTGEYLNVKINPWIGNNKRVRGSWEYFPGKNNDDALVSHYNYSLIKVTPSEESVVFSGLTEESFIDLVLPDEYDEDNKYYLEVNATMSSTRETLQFRSIKSLFDFTMPTISTVETNQYSTANNIYVSWNTSDNRGIKDIRAIVSWSRTSEMPNGEVIVNKYNSDLIQVSKEISGTANLSELITNIGIQTGDNVFVKIFAEDLAGNIVSENSSVIFIDNSAPPAFSIVDQGDFINPELNDFYFDWIWSEDDKDSPVNDVYYQLTVNGVIAQDWIKTANSKELALAIPEKYKKEEMNGKTIALAVKKVNAAGLSTIGLSNGITLDSTAGKIENARFTFGPDNIDLIYYTNNRDITLWVTGHDKESGITRLTAELGTFNNDRWIPYADGGIDKISLDGKIDIVLPSVIEENERFRYKITWYNGTETASAPFYTKELVFKPALPDITNIDGFYNNGQFTVKWSSELQIPFKEGKLVLESDSYSSEVLLSHNSGQYSFNNPDPSGNIIPDGQYHFELMVMDVANGTDNKNSPIFVKDTIKPELLSLSSNSFVSSKLGFNAVLNEDIRSYSYLIGTIEDSSFFTKRWLEGSNSGNKVDVDNIDLSVYKGIELLDQSVIQLTLRFEDEYGNWSENESALLRVDLTAPSTPVISKVRDVDFFNEDFTLDKSLEFSSNVLKGIKWSSTDDLSGISGYKWSVLKDINEEIVDWNISDSSIFRDINVVDLKGLAFNHNDSVYVALKSINGAGVESEVGFSEIITIDNEAPRCILDMSSENGKTLISGNSVSTYNGEGEIEIVVDSELSSVIYYEAKIYDPFNKEVYSKSSFINNTATPSVNKINFIPAEDIYGVYRCVIEFYDPGMYKSVIEKEIRYNSPPYPIVPDDITVNPMRPFTLDGNQWFTDSDGIENAIYSVHDGDKLIWQSRDLVSSMELMHKDTNSQVSNFILTAETFDTLGASSKVFIPIKVENTKSGILYTNEYWSGSHKINGTVIVPADLTLIIEDGTVIEINTGGVYGYNQELIIDTGGLLNHLGSARYLNNDKFGNWGGIVVKGSSNFDNISITGANRGLTIDSNEIFNLSNSVFDGNIIGLHLVKANTVSVNNCEFKNNTYYGIKEEKGINPSVSNSLFVDNAFDYYDSLATVISFSDLNNLDINSGNRGE